MYWSWALSLNLCNEFSVTLCLSSTKSKIIRSNGLLNFLHSSMIQFSLSMNNLSVQNPWAHLLTFQCLWFHCFFVQQKNLYHVWTISTCSFPIYTIFHLLNAPPQVPFLQSYSYAYETIYIQIYSFSVLCHFSQFKLLPITVLR